MSTNASIHSNFGWLQKETSSRFNQINSHDTIREDKQFEPYVDNGGTILGLACSDFVVLACDNRLSENYLIKSRNISRIIQVSDNIFFAGICCFSDFSALKQLFARHMSQFLWENNHVISIEAFSSYLAILLYSRRTFPFYTFSIAVGIDRNGHGALYNYDAVGSFERVKASCVGKGQQLIQPMLDEISCMDEDDALWDLSGKSEGKSPFLELKEDEAVNLVKKAFLAAAEREISIGDGAEIYIISRDKHVKRMTFALPKH